MLFTTTLFNVSSDFYTVLLLLCILLVFSLVLTSAAAAKCKYTAVCGFCFPGHHYMNTLVNHVRLFRVLMGPVGP